MMLYMFSLAHIRIHRFACNTLSVLLMWRAESLSELQIWTSVNFSARFRSIIDEESVAKQSDVKNTLFVRLTRAKEMSQI